MNRIFESSLFRWRLELRDDGTVWQTHSSRARLEHPIRSVSADKLQRMLNAGEIVEIPSDEPKTTTEMVW